MSEEKLEIVPEKKRGRGQPRKGSIHYKGAPPDIAEKNIRLLAEDAAKAIVAGKDLPKGDNRWLDSGLTAITRSNLAALVGEDFERARQLFADYLFDAATRVLLRINNEVDELPHSNLAFTLSVLVDKGEALRTKLATSSRGAQVNVQINQFGPGDINREELIKQLTGNLAPADKPAEPVNITPPPRPTA